MKIMAIDYGDARTGFAISDRSEFLASPIGNLFLRETPKGLQIRRLRRRLNTVQVR